MRKSLRKLVFTTHVTSSVGWIGAVLVHSVLALLALIAATVLATYKPFGSTPYGRMPVTKAHAPPIR